MKILFAADIPPDQNSGAAGTELQTINALRELGHEVDCLWADDLGRRIQHGNLHYLLELPRVYARVLDNACSKKDYDVLHVNQEHCFLAAIQHRRRKRSGYFVCRSHGLDDHMRKILSDWRRILEVKDRSWMKKVTGRVIDRMLDRHVSLACKGVDGFIVSSSVDARFLIEHHGMAPERVACIPQAASDVFLEPLRDFTQERSRKILFVGSAYWKGIHAVAAAVNCLLESDKSLSMTWICSNDSLPSVQRMLNPAVLPYISFPGWVAQEKLIEIYDTHGFFLSPSLFEGFCKVFLEAMARGLCVIGTHAGGMADIIRQNENGVLVEFNSPDEIYRRVMELVHDPDRCFHISHNAAETAREYSWKRVAEETFSFYEYLIGEV